MPLTDRQIHLLVNQDNLLDPFNPSRLSSMGYDMAPSKEFKIPLTNTDLQIIDPFDPPTFHTEYYDDYIIIPPHSFVLSSSEEYFRIPKNILGICLGRSTYARSGLLTHITPLEPGWEGNVTLEISNTNSLPVRVWVGRGITQVVFFQSDEYPILDYASKGGRYQGQRGVTQGRPETGT